MRWFMNNLVWTGTSQCNWLLTYITAAISSSTRTALQAYHPIPKSRKRLLSDVFTTRHVRNVTEGFHFDRVGGGASTRWHVLPTCQQFKTNVLLSRCDEAAILASRRQEKELLHRKKIEKLKIIVWNSIESDSQPDYISPYTFDGCTCDLILSALLFGNSHHDMTQLMPVRTRIRYTVSPEKGKEGHHNRSQRRPSFKYEIERTLQRFSRAVYRARPVWKVLEHRAAAQQVQLRLIASGQL